MSASLKPAAAKRARLIRLAHAAAELLRTGGEPARVCVILDASRTSASCEWRELPAGGRALEFRLPPNAGPKSLPAAFARARAGRPYPSARRSKPGKVLLFRSLLTAPGKEGVDRLNQGTLYLASALRHAGAPIVFSDVKVSRFVEDASQRQRLAATLKEHPDIALVALGLYDAYFEDATQLVSFIRARSSARIAVGALMPTRDPEVALAHLPEADFVGRGAGEEVLPRLASLAAASAAGTFDEAARAQLLCLDGVLACDGENSAVWAGAERVSRVELLDEASLDLSFLDEHDVASGATFCLSRGCSNACHFCTSPDQGHFHGKTPREVGLVLAAYGRRLKQLYGSWAAAPEESFGLGFYDDDFLSDPARAVAILDVVKRSPFHLRFVQASIRAFFETGPGGRCGALRTRVLNALSDGPFEPKKPRGAGACDPQMYIGTESFCDAELKRLGKGYGTREVELVAWELSRRGIRQAHHLIATNAQTRPEDVLETLSRIARLKQDCGEPFAVLEPVISHLISFPGTASARALDRAGLSRQVARRGILSLPGFPEFDYPLVERDVPSDPDVAAWAETLETRPRGIDWEVELEKLLFEWLLRSESLSARGEQPPRAARLRRAVDLQAARWEAVA